MLEYFSQPTDITNWSAEDLQACAQEAAGGLEQLDAWGGRRSYTNGGNTGEFFEATIANLRKATMRLIVFPLEKFFPFELAQPCRVSERTTQGD